ncbi:hypothetical protein [Nocardioides aurantiacus]|uniref:hypothetical protein n=1 Tax=Nocardioides aurantiacus TaxID=86796 RepID=UPI00403F5736
MPAPVVEALVLGRPCAVAAALVTAVRSHGGTLSGVGGFGSVVTWRVLDAALDLVELQAEVDDAPGQPGVTRLRVTRVDAALASTERFVSPPLPTRADRADRADRTDRDAG